MEARKEILQRMGIKSEDALSLAERYYNILFAMNGFKFTQREVQLVAFAAVRGNMTYGNIREDFCRKYDTTSPTINNMISKKLKPMGILVKVDGKVKVNPKILLDFKNVNIILEIKLDGEFKPVIKG
jgi:hypothetical protein